MVCLSQGKRIKIVVETQRIASLRQQQKHNAAAVCTDVACNVPIITKHNAAVYVETRCIASLRQQQQNTTSPPYVRT
jgi:hypothetical protein